MRLVPGLTIVVMFVAAAVFGLHASEAPRLVPLRVCADPNNLPFSNMRREGFENRLAGMLAAHIGTQVEYTWWPQRRGFIRNTLQAGTCDIVIGVPTQSDMTLNSQPYYRSGFVFVARRSMRPPVASLDDERLAALRIGVQMVGDDFATTPPAHALAVRGLVRNIRGYSVLGDYTEPNPPARIIDAVARGEVDVAVVWGPLAGYFARRTSPALQITPIRASERRPVLPMTFDMSMGVRKGDIERLRVLNEFLGHHRAAIGRLLDEYGVPRVGVVRETS